MPKMIKPVERSLWDGPAGSIGAAAGRDSFISEISFQGWPDAVRRRKLETVWAVEVFEMTGFHRFSVFQSGLMQAGCAHSRTESSI
jgi:hypothetical protein